MCGVLLYLDRNNGVDIKNFHRALNLQEHRGPDDYGIFCMEDLSDKKLKNIRAYRQKQTKKPKLIIGHRRLSIIDTSSKSRQPFVNLSQNKFLSYNGEFYNFDDYSTNETQNSDGLTLFNLLNENSISGFNHINGMWASIYGDLNRDRVYLSRDRYGKKPLYYFIDKSRLIVSSEIKSIFSLMEQSREVNHEALAFYLIGKLSPYLSNGQSFYKNINSVMPGENLVFDIRKHSIRKHSNIDFPEQNYFSKPLNDKSFKEQLEYELENSVKLRLRSDVKVGILVSGGVDSSMIAGFSNKNTDLSYYTCNIVDSNNNITEDLYYSRKLAKSLGKDISEIDIDSVSKESFYSLAEKLTKQAEIPINFLLASIPTYLISQRMNEDGVAVSLDGIGGDEIMGGYPSYQSLSIANATSGNLINSYKYFIEWISQFDPNLMTRFKFSINLLKKIAFDRDNFQSHNPGMMKYANTFKNDELNRFLLDLDKNYFYRNTLCTNTDRQLFEVKKYQLPYYLGLADDFNMMNSVENRSPFLDYRLNKYIYMPEEFKIKNHFNKFLLRSLMPSNIPEEIRWRKGKIGIGTPFNYEYLSSEHALSLILDSSFIRSIISEKIITKDFKSIKQLTRPLFSIALLDHAYNLK
jgi:asparagine synthase (glutamine-hydrolysing)